VVVVLSHFGKQNSTADEHSIQNILLNVLLDAHSAQGGASRKIVAKEPDEEKEDAKEGGNEPGEEKEAEEGKKPAAEKKGAPEKKPAPEKKGAGA
jgi:hypothetical protein